MSQLNDNCNLILAKYEAILVRSVTCTGWLYVLFMSRLPLQLNIRSIRYWALISLLSKDNQLR